MNTFSPGTRFLIYGAAIGFSVPFFNSAILQSVPTYNKSTTNKTFIVTGATSNLGKALTMELARRKMRVVMACRNLEECRMLRREVVVQTGNHKLLCRHLDLEDIDSINKFVEDISKEEPHIDVLVNNAAVKDVPTKEMTKYGIEKNFFVNFLGPFLLTTKLLPKLEESAAITKNSRIINVIGTPKNDWEVDLKDINFDQKPYNSKKAYKQSKLALAYFTILLDKLNREQKNCVYVYGFSPCRNQIAESLEHTETFKEHLISVLKAYYCAKPQKVIQGIIRLATDPDLTELHMSGRLYLAYGNTKWFWRKVVKDENMGKKVWNAGIEKLTELQKFSESSNTSNNKDEPN